MAITATTSTWVASLVRERDLTLTGLVVAGLRLSLQQLTEQAAGQAGGTVLSYVDRVALGHSLVLDAVISSVVMAATVLNGWTGGLTGAGLQLVLPVGGPVWAGLIPVGSAWEGVRSSARWARSTPRSPIHPKVRVSRNASTHAVVEDGGMRFSILIVDDSAPFREVARQLLDHEGFDVVGTASSGAEAVAGVAEHRPQIALVDINLGADSGFDVARRLAAGGQSPGTAVVLMSTHAADEYADLIEQSPAVGFVAKERLSGDAVRLALAHGS